MASEPAKDQTSAATNDVLPAARTDGEAANKDVLKSKRVTELVDQLENAAGSAPITNVSKGDAQSLSREASPTRPSMRSSNIPQLSRSRKNSHDLSPTRVNGQAGAASTVPSAAAIQRALSAPRTQLLPAVDGVLEGAKSDVATKSGPASPVWPTSPRLRSPPPSATASRRKAENEPQSNTSSKRMTSAPEQLPKVEPKETATDRSPPPSGSRTAASRGASTHSGLETVEEGSAPSTPAIGPMLDSYMKKNADADTGQPEQPLSTTSTRTLTQEPAVMSSQEAEAKPKTPATSALRPSNTLAKRSFTSLTGSKTKPGSEPLRSITVETEPVTSVPQIIDRGTSGRDGSGSVRTKASSETIRPKKEKKKSARKTPSLQAGTGTSKADIFEAKVASAVDEADTSDSDETFVYESNPPDTRPNRHHSRTPSAASLASQNDPLGYRNKHGLRGGSHAVTGKKSMKFTNSTYSNIDGEHAGDSTRSRNGSSTPRHHHIGRYSRTGHPSIMDNDSPFTLANKPSSPRVSTGNLVKSPRPNSPRLVNGRLFSNGKKGDTFPDDPYDDVADDERAPLIGSVRINRNRYNRRPGSRLRQFEDTPSSCLSRYGACIVITLLLLLVCIGAGVFLIAMNRPLMNVSIKHIQNVLASEQELMLDLHVKATNPNLFSITVSDLDVNVFAESPYVGTADDWRKSQQNHHHRGPSGRRFHRQTDTPPDVSVSWPWPPWPADGGVDEGTDPIDNPGVDDPESGGQKMLLGQVFEFDSPLLFEASPIRRQFSSSVAEIRLAKPGNRTEEGGSARWEKVLQHPFELIVRGVIKYQLPLSSKVKSTKIAGSIHVTPEDDAGGGGNSSRWRD